MDRYTPLPNRSNLLTLRFFLYEHAGRVSRVLAVLNCFLLMYRNQFVFTYFTVYFNINQLWINFQINVCEKKSFIQYTYAIYDNCILNVGAPLKRHLKTCFAFVYESFNVFPGL